MISMWMNLDGSERVAERNGLLREESHGMATHHTVQEQMDPPWNSHMSLVPDSSSFFLFLLIFKIQDI